MKKYYERYTIDEILDKYNETNDDRLITYLYLVSNKIDILNFMKQYNFSFKEAYFFLLNVDLFLDDEPEWSSVEEFQKFYDINIDDIEENLFDYL